jgi:hypothetical protein
MNRSRNFAFCREKELSWTIFDLVQIIHYQSGISPKLTVMTITPGLRVKVIRKL